MKQLQVTTPHCLVVTGLPGSGKTTFAEVFSEIFNAPLLDIAAVQSFVDSQLPARQLTDELLRQFFRTGQTIVVEPASGSKTDRTEVIKLAKKNGYTPILVWVQTDETIARKRSTIGTRTRPAYYTAETFEKAVRVFTAPSDDEKPCVISGMHTQATQLKVVLKRISSENGREKLPVITSTPRRPSKPGLVQ